MPAKTSRPVIDLRQPGKARPIYERALTIQDHHYPHGHPLTTVLKHNLRAVAPDLIILDNGTVLPENPRPTDPHPQPNREL